MRSGMAGSLSGLLNLKEVPEENPQGSMPIPVIEELHGVGEGRQPC